MKKIFFAAAFVLCALASKAEVVSRDTVAYNGDYKLEVKTTYKKNGEINVRYVAILFDPIFADTKGNPGKVTITRATYESGRITHLVYNNKDNGSRTLSKAVNVTSK